MAKAKAKQSQSIIEKYASEYPWVTKAIHIPEVDMYVIAVPPTELSENPKNWRVHNQRQRSTYKAFKKKQGWLGFTTFNLRSGKLLDGHMRVDEATKSGDSFVPVMLVDKTEAEENEILATLDNIGLLAQRNTDALNSLLEASNKAVDNVTVKSDEAERKLAQLRKDVQESLGSTDSPSVLLPQAKTRIRAKDASDEEKSTSKSKSNPSLPEESDDYEPEVDVETVIEDINESVLYPGTSDMGIPILLPEMMCKPDQAPTKVFNGRDNYGNKTYHCYGQQFTDGQNYGCIGFYIEDDKFDACYASPGSFVDFLREVDPKVLITPDFSCYPTAWPLVMNLWNVYRSRWVGRFWQELGFTIIPTIQILDPPGRYNLYTTQYSIKTLPSNTQVVSIECRKMGNDTQAAKRDLVPLLEMLAKVMPDLRSVLLYGGEEKQKYIHGHVPIKCVKSGRKIDYIYLPQVYTEKKKRKRRSV